MARNIKGDTAAAVSAKHNYLILDIIECLFFPAWCEFGNGRIEGLVVCAEDTLNEVNVVFHFLPAFQQPFHVRLVTFSFFVNSILLLLFLFDSLQTHGVQSLQLVNVNGWIEQTITRRQTREKQNCSASPQPTIAEKKLDHSHKHSGLRLLSLHQAPKR